MNEALERIKGHFNPKDIVNKELFEEDFNTIEKKLKETETYKEILNDYGLTLADFREACLLLTQWKNNNLCWADYDRQKKALEIINKKSVNVLMFKAHFIISKPEYEEYQYYLDNCEKYSFSAFYLTKQEFDLLKEVLR